MIPDRWLSHEATSNLNRRKEMPIIQITAPLVNGDLWDPLDEDNASCQDAVDLVCGDDLRPPPTSVIIKVTTDSGKDRKSVV